MIKMLSQKDLISILDLNRDDLDLIFSETTKIKAKPDIRALEGKVISSCFFEASTRTRLSFESAIGRLGAKVIGFSDSLNTSFGKKGESLVDTIRMLEGYSDAIVIRHPLDGSARLAANISNKPVINGGDGANQHPTQTLLDLYTINEHHGKIDGLSIALVGDLKYGRTVHSLAQACALFDKVRFYFVAPELLRMPDYICQYLTKAGVKYSFHNSLSDVLPKVDVIYMTRFQKERFAKDDDSCSPYILNSKILDEYAKDSACVLHPLPRVDELDVSVDNTKYAKYFGQAENGLYVRQAILKLLVN